MKENNLSNIDKAIKIALEAHFGQVDKGGKPYILHPLRLMMKFQNETEMIVAVLHDVIEDSDYSIDDLKKTGFPNEVTDALECLTKKNQEKYDDFILRIISNSLAKKIKIEDIKDNLDFTRLTTIGEKDLVRITKYHRALKYLEK